MATIVERAAAFRGLHRADGTFVIPNPFDVGSAMILAGMGFKALATSSSGYAATIGRRDMDVARDVMLAHCRDVVAAVDIPVSADLENGYGETLDDVAATYRMALDTGLSGGSIEDSTQDKDDPIFPLDVAVDRVKAAVAVAREADKAGRPFVLTARAENFLWGRPDLDDTIQRLQAYEAAGAEVLYAPGLPDLDAVAKVCASVKRPVNVLIGTPGLPRAVAPLAAAGAKRISLGGILSRAAYGGMMSAARELLDGGTADFLDGMVGYRDIAKHLKKPGE